MIISCIPFFASSNKYKWIGTVHKATQGFFLNSFLAYEKIKLWIVAALAVLVQLAKLRLQQRKHQVCTYAVTALLSQGHTFYLSASIRSSSTLSLSQPCKKGVYERQEPWWVCRNPMLKTPSITLARRLLLNNIIIVFGWGWEPSWISFILCFHVENLVSLPPRLNFISCFMKMKLI